MTIRTNYRVLEFLKQLIRLPIFVTHHILSLLDVSAMYLPSLENDPWHDFFKMI